MSKFVKTAIAAAMVMGAFTSTATIAAGNNGTARFYGTIEDSVCSIVPDDHKLEVDMGDIGAEKLKNNGTTTPKSFQIRLQDCVFDTQETMTTTFTGTVSSANSGNYYTIFNTDTGAAFNNVSLAIGDSLGTSYKSGMGIENGVIIAAICRRNGTSKGSGHCFLSIKYAILQTNLETFRRGGAVIFQFFGTDITHINFQFVIVRDDRTH